MSRKRPHPEADDSKPNHGQHRIYKSEALTDRSSTFVGAFLPQLASQPPPNPKTLQSHPDFASASHRILAWRLPSAQQTLKLSQPTGNATQKQKQIYDIGHDDDGEQYAGKRVATVLERLDVAGVCVVARWYGGIMLGPVRFKHIEGVAVDAIKQWQAEGGKREVDGQDAEGSVKKAKVSEEDEAVIKDGLVKALRDRDANIVVLRDLLDEKQNAAKKAERRAPDASKEEDVTDEGAEKKKGETDDVPVVVEQKKARAPPLDYSRMPLPTLRQLEKARDATLTWILKQLDDVGG